LGFPLSRLAGGRWERGSGGEVQGGGTSGDFDGALELDGNHISVLPVSRTNDGLLTN
jgi:hypothetical protein